MTYEELLEIVDSFSEETDAFDLYSSPKFQVNQSDGLIITLWVNRTKQKAWFEVNESVISDSTDVFQYKKRCIDFGIQECTGIVDLNNILKSFGLKSYPPEMLPYDEEYSTNTLQLSKEESKVLEELVEKALCGYTDEQTENVLKGLEEKFANLNSNKSLKSHRGMKL